jgi:hypothetical protein
MNSKMLPINTIFLVRNTSTSGASYECAIYNFVTARFDFVNKESIRIGIFQELPNLEDVRAGFISFTNDELMSDKSLLFAPHDHPSQWSRSIYDIRCGYIFSYKKQYFAAFISSESERVQKSYLWVTRFQQSDTVSSHSLPSRIIYFPAFTYNLYTVNGKKMITRKSSELTINYLIELKAMWERMLSLSQDNFMNISLEKELLINFESNNEEDQDSTHEKCK